MKPQHIGIVAIIVVALLGIWLATGKGGKSAADEAATKNGQKAGAEGPGGAAGDKVVKAEEGLSDKAEAKAEDLALPGALPTLKNVQGADNPPPAQPHGKLELEGDVQEADAELAIKAVFPALRDCYVELRKIAPQAGGRMLMKFSVKPATEPGQAALGELFLKETQFTEPKFLTCIRSAVDAAKFPVGKNLSGSVTVPLFLTPGDAGGEPAAAPAAPAAPAK